MGDWGPLPVGVTGFSLAARPLPKTDVRAFKSACYAVTHATGLRLTAFAEPEYWSSYRTARLVSRTEDVSVLCHSLVPWVAFAASTENVRFRFEFVAPPAWAEHFGWAGLTPLSLEFLRAPAAEADLSALPGHERREIGYWKPDTVGELAFNYWD
ncbi:hypothetical protein RM780_13595 [Streptomyces sp. DSM 44917]|uniref:Uncharacterized protein n=1 Tax=Streptomyces boetiae TaxID=3075541 RepID=A0ABU2L934_9ACTN|nr:hypothetical protein [Streptomyces sp. DSM 44917]MDT0307991.1 hypothetical protein [Streptomyces sp. DSM 44917]